MAMMRQVVWQQQQHQQEMAAARQQAELLAKQREMKSASGRAMLALGQVLAVLARALSPAELSDVAYTYSITMERAGPEVAAAAVVSFLPRSSDLAVMISSILRDVSAPAPQQQHNNNKRYQRDQHQWQPQQQQPQWQSQAWQQQPQQQLQSQQQPQQQPQSQQQQQQPAAPAAGAAGPRQQCAFCFKFVSSQTL